MSAQTEIRIGSEFVGYRLDELIGRGGMGVVYRAYDLRLKRTVALKLMAPELALDQGFRERFGHEAELAMSLEHPNVVPIHDAGDIDGRLYIAMRLVEGSDLRELLRRETLDPARALAICSQVANALDAAHAKGLVHRDVKPSNVLLDAGEHVYLADFGLTRRLDEQVGPAGEVRSVGTPAYLAPEQIDGGSIDARTDVYSLGCLLYQCLAGEVPFAGRSRLAVAWAHLELEPPSASERRPGLPDAVDAVIRKAMAKEPEQRYPTCAALTAAAGEALGLRSEPAVHRRRLLIIGGGATAIVLAAVVATAAIVRVTGTSGGVAPAVTENSLVRIDPATRKVDAVVGVGALPLATAVGDRRVWVYGDVPPSVSEIDTATRTRRHTTAIVAAPIDRDAFSGPVLAADRGGAWVIGADARQRSYLTRVFSGLRGKREYRLQDEPRAVAVGYGAVWVVVRGARDNRVLRIDPATGKITKQTHFASSAPIDGLAVGLGGVWVVASSTGTLYRINPQSARRTGQIDLGKRAARPELVLGSIWVGLPDSEVSIVIVDPRTLYVFEHFGIGSNEGNVTVEGSSVWSDDPPTGTVEQWDGQTYQSLFNIRVTDPPSFDGFCLTSIASGAGAVWVTVAPNIGSDC